MVKGRIGVHDTRIQSDKDKIFIARSMHIHPDYNHRYLINDICVVKFDKMNLEQHDTGKIKSLKKNILIQNNI